MKRHTGAIAALVILILCAAARPLQALPGDANNNGVIDEGDVLAILDHVLGRSVAPGQADCNGDNKITVADAVSVIKILGRPVINIRDYFILSPNSNWHYTGFKGGSPDDDFRWTVLDDKKDVGGGKMATRIKTDTDQPTDDRNLDEDFWLLEPTGEIYFYGFHKGSATSSLPVQDVVLTDPVLIGMDGMTTGTKITDTGAGTVTVYVSSFPVQFSATFNSTFTYTDIIPVQETPLGRFTNALRVLVDINIAAGPYSIPLHGGTFILKQGVGMIVQDQQADPDDAEIQAIDSGQVAGTAIQPDLP